MRVLAQYTGSGDLNNSLTFVFSSSVRETVRVRVRFTGLASTGDITLLPIKIPFGGSSFSLSTSQAITRAGTSFEMIYPGTGLSNQGSGVYELDPDETLRVTVSSTNSADTNIPYLVQFLNALRTGRRFRRWR